MGPCAKSLSTMIDIVLIIARAGVQVTPSRFALEGSTRCGRTGALFEECLGRRRVRMTLPRESAWETHRRTPYSLVRLTTPLTHQWLFHPCPLEISRIIIVSRVVLLLPQVLLAESGHWSALELDLQASPNGYLHRPRSGYALAVIPCTRPCAHSTAPLQFLTLSETLRALFWLNQSWPISHYENRRRPVK